MTIYDIIAKRKAIWESRHDIQYDEQYRTAAVNWILSDKKIQSDVYDKPYLLIEAIFSVVDKEKHTVPFFLNEVQQEFIRIFEENGTGRPYLVLKGRQQGFTSLITAMQLCYAITRKNFQGLTISNSSDNTRTIFNDKGRVVYEKLPADIRPTEKYSNVTELFFDRLNSSWRIATASKDVGRSRSPNFIHFSEAAFFECPLSEMQASIGEAATADAFQIYESTANGFNEFKDLWDSESCINCFFEWWRTSEYRESDLSWLNTSDSWLSQRLLQLRGKGLDEQQLAWYARKYNSYLDKNTIKQEYPCTPEEAFIASGDCIFDKETIQNRIISLAKQKKRKGRFEYKVKAVPVMGANNEIVATDYSITDIEFKELPDGYITIYEEPRTSKKDYAESKCPYVIGGDTAGTGIDYFVGKVLDNTDGHTVAVLHKARMDEDLYAEQMYCLGRYFNDALIGIETNYSRYPIRVLQKYGYPNLYTRERVTGFADVPEKVFGFETTTKTKPIIISNLVALMREDINLECDIPTLKEMTTFVKKPNGSTSAVDGAHDDLVMATAIAHFIGINYTHNFVVEEKSDFVDIDKLFKFKEETPEGNSNYMNWEDF